MVDNLILLQVGYARAAHQWPDGRAEALPYLVPVWLAEGLLVGLPREYWMGLDGYMGPIPDNITYMLKPYGEG